MRQTTTIFFIETRGRGFHDVTGSVRRWAEGRDMKEGLLTVFIRHTSASLMIQENADPDVLADLADALERFAPRAFPYRHKAEGADDMPAHIKASLSKTHLSVPLQKGKLVLGEWQAIYLVEHRDQPHRREVVLYLSGE